MKEMTLKEMQNFELDILKDFHEFCVSNNIRYSLDGGTLIGAIRHKGFIPWDDDIDVVLPRPDYEKLCSLYQSEKYRLKCFQNDKNCYLGFARIYDFKYTTFDTRYPWCKDKNVGLWIDIFPADGAPDNEDELQKLYGKVLEYRMKTMKPRYAKAHFSFHGSIHSNLSILKWKILTLNGAFARKYTKRLIETAQTYAFGSTSRFASLTIIGEPSEHTHCQMSAWEECKLVDFENTKLYIMGGYDEFLRIFFGDYMQLPPEEERIPKQQSYIKFYWK